MDLEDILTACKLRALENRVAQTGKLADRPMRTAGLHARECPVRVRAGCVLECKLKTTKNIAGQALFAHF